jgi:RNA polymerase sigma factor (sigma-70 family)
MQVPPAIQNWMQRNPTLTREREMELICRVKAGDKAALEPLVGAYMRLVLKIAADHAKRQRNTEIWLDLVLAGVRGLIEAIDRYDIDKASHWSDAAVELKGSGDIEQGQHAPVRLGTLAMHWIRAMVAEAQTRSWTVVHCTKTAPVRRALTHLQKAKQALGPDADGDIDRLASWLQVKPEDVREAMRVSQGDVALDAPIRKSDGGASESTIGETLRDDRSPGEDDIIAAMDHRRKRLAVAFAINNLKRREKMVVICRNYLPAPMTLEDLAHVMRVSRERVRQIEFRAFERYSREAKRLIRLGTFDEGAAVLAARALGVEIRMAAKGGENLIAALSLKGGAHEEDFNDADFADEPSVSIEKKPAHRQVAPEKLVKSSRRSQNQMELA